MSKDLINTGVAGDQTTGDTLFVGGNKINKMFDEIYSAFGPAGANPQDIHATGYFQNPPSSFYTFPFPPGYQANVDTRSGARTVKLPNGKIGEMIRIRDIYGTWGNSPVTVVPDGLEKINGSVQNVVLNSKFLVVTFICVSDTPGDVNWTYNLQKLDATDVRLFDLEVIVPKSTVTEIDLGPVDSFSSIDIKITGVAVPNGTDSTISKIVLVHNGSICRWTESAILNTGNKLYEINFEIISNRLIAKVTTPADMIRLALKSTDYTLISI